jgi:hypothetical protein
MKAAKAALGGSGTCDGGLTEGATAGAAVLPHLVAPAAAMTVRAFLQSMVARVVNEAAWLAYSVEGLLDSGGVCAAKGIVTSGGGLESGGPSGHATGQQKPHRQCVVPAGAVLLYRGLRVRMGIHAGAAFLMMRIVFIAHVFPTALACLKSSWLPTSCCYRPSSCHVGLNALEQLCFPNEPRPRGSPTGMDAGARHVYAVREGAGAR